MMNDNKDDYRRDDPADEDFNMDDPDSLPWLETDGEYEEESTTGKTIAMVLGGIALLALVIGAIFFIQHQRRGGEGGNGELIAAQEGDYKVKPDDPQGKEFEGEGDAAFAASEGKRVDNGQASPAGAKSSSGGSALVQLAAFSSSEQAQEGWKTLTGRYAALKGAERRITQATVDGRKMFRLNAAAADAKAANELCNQLKSAGGSCIVVR